jgi:DedD protein
MAGRSEAPDLAVDELKRRARRRLVGAIVLALAAAVLLPLLLENEPKPLGDEVSIQIPPVDNGKFVNPLSPGKGGTVKGSAEESAKKAAPAADSAPAVTQPAPAPPPGEEKRSDTSSAAPANAPPGPPASTPAPPPATAPAEAKKEALPEPKAGGNQSGAPPAASGFVVQVAAFTDRYGARAQARKLKAAGFPAYVESVPNGNSELQRVRVGPYPSRDAADAARAKLKAAGYDAIVARAR